MAVPCLLVSARYLGRLAGGLPAIVPLPDFVVNLVLMLNFMPD
ncbi:hypothetical protein [Arthrobacter hankyongi]|nr:hypothetical protein [Arthrobacter hankyongi]